MLLVHRRCSRATLDHGVSASAYFVCARSGKDVRLLHFIPFGSVPGSALRSVQLSAYLDILILATTVIPFMLFGLSAST